jgi:flagellar motor switch protein FliG
METLFKRLMRGVVTVMNKSSRESERDFILAFEKIDPEMAEEIKKCMFVFDDIVVLSDESIQKVLRKIEMDDLSKALKAAGPKAYEKIIRNMSKRAAEHLKKDMDESGPIRIEEIDKVQQRIIGVIRSLEKKGEISVQRSTEK